MKKQLIVILAAVLTVSASAENLLRSFYFDFGTTTNASKGAATEGADVFGHYWNNINSTAVNVSFSLVDAGNNSTGITLTSMTTATANGMSGGGGLLTPDTALLGDLGITTATEDYLFASNSAHMTFKISGLDAAKGYRFKVFGSRSATDIRISDYTFRGKWAIQGSLQAAGTGIGANGENQNTSNVYLSPVMRPAADGTITLSVHRQYAGSGAYFPINAMRMEEFSDLHAVDHEMYIDCGHSDGTNGETTTSPDADGIYWNNLYNNATSAAAVSLVYSDGNSVNNGANVTITSGFSRNGYKNGGDTAVSTYPAILGAFAKKSVMGDYFFSTSSSTGTMSFNGLDANKSYVFYIIGSRQYNSSFGQTVDKLKFEGYNSCEGTHHTGGNGLCYSGATYGWNEDAFYESDPIFPTTDGTITLSLSSARGSYVHINGIRIEEYSDYDRTVVVPPTLYSSLSMKGTGVEDNNISMHLVATQGATEGLNFETFCTLTNGGTISFEAADGTVLYTGTVSAETGIYRVRFNTENARPVYTAITHIGFGGNVTSTGWSNTGLTMTYRGSGVWQDTLTFIDYPKTSGTDAKRGAWYINNSWDPAAKMFEDEEGVVCLSDEATTVGFTANDVFASPGTHIVTLDLRNFVYAFDCVEDDSTEPLITFFGSSVCNGQGATDYQGYAYQYMDGKTGYRYLNNSIGGNNTINLFKRFYGNLEAACTDYAVIGLGLGNEGLHGAADQQAIYNQWKNNMDSLIRRAEAAGISVVATNNYPRGDYDSIDYSYVKRMNLEMQEWDVPTVNFLGALDNCQGNGQWADGYQNGTDVYHPNTEGHTEFMHTFVPSLFDALEQGKALPTRQTGEGMALAANDTIKFSPEGNVHPYSMAMRIKTTTAGQIGTMVLNGSTVALTIPAAAADGAWHTLLLSHYHAAGKTYTYLDGVLLDESENTQVLSTVTITGMAMQISDLHFWRAGLNANEVSALQQGKMLRSSLELYCPLNDGNTDNLAQSINTITLKLHPSPATALTDVDAEAEGQLYNVLGQPVGKDYKGIVVSKSGKYFIR